MKAGWNKVIVDPNNQRDTAGVAKGAVGYRSTTTGANVADINVVRYYDGNAEFMLGAVYVTPAEPEKDTNKVGTTLVSANITKDVANVKPVTSANISVVNTSDLKGGVSGVPSKQAYKSESDWKDGIVFPVSISDETAADIMANGAYLDAWVHITGVTANNFVFRFFKEGGRNGIGGQVYQLNSWEQGVQKWEAGWYHFVWQIKAGTDLTGVVEMTAHDHGNATVNPAPTSSSFSVAAVRIVPTAADAQKGWGVTSATGDAVNVAMVVVAILLAAMAASVTVYFGKKAR